MSLTSTTSLKLDVEMKARVQRLADSQRRTSHWIMREAIEEYVSREERRDTLASWEHDETTGLHVTDEEMDRWAAKLKRDKQVPSLKCHV
jgi:predicted transcriptional regulator